MKIRFGLALVVVMALLTAPLAAQTTAFPTVTAGAALSATGTTVTVSSTASMSAPGPTSGGTFLYWDLEQMRVMRVISSTQVQVTRGVAGFPSAHATGGTIYYGPGNAFKDVDPPIGTCSPSAWSLYTTWINISNGNMSVCQARTASTRTVITTNARSITYGSTPQACGTGISC